MVVRAYLFAMSVYNETTIPYNNNIDGGDSKKTLKPTLVFSKPFTSKIKDYVQYKKGKLSEIPLYVDEPERSERCDSTACTILNYAVLVTCSILFLGLIAYYSYVGYRSGTKI